MPAPISYRLSPDEQRHYREQGYLVRTGVFSTAELAEITDACEALVADLVRDRRAPRIRAGSYVFDPDLERAVIIKWEGESDVVHGIEPVAHLCPRLAAWAHDPRLIEPAKDFLGVEAPMLFTEKLNLKRPLHGGKNPLHQDYPYWRKSAADAEQIMTSMIFLDDATLENGCLFVVPGSHRSGMWSTRTDGDRFLGNEIDVSAYPDVRPIPLEAAAGTVVSFGAYLVHRSAPNTSSLERRALLLSYQPAGGHHQVDNLRRMAARPGGSR